MIRTVVVSALLIAAVPAIADPVKDAEKRLADAMKADIGKEFWVANPRFPVLLCPTPKATKGCAALKDVELKVEGVIYPAFPASLYKVRLRDGRVGYVSGNHGQWFRPTSLTPKQRAAIAKCEVDGAKIGMTANDLMTCWGIPTNRSTTEVSAGKIERWHYWDQGDVYLTNNVVTMIHRQGR